MAYVAMVPSVVEFRTPTSANPPTLAASRQRVIARMPTTGPQAVVGVQQGERATFVDDSNLRCRVDTAGLQAADGVLQPRDAEGIESGGLAKGALQAGLGGGGGVRGRHLGALVHLLIEGAQARRGDVCDGV